MQAAPHTYALYSKHCRAVSARNLFVTNQDFSKIIVILVISTSLHHSEILRGSFSLIEIIRLSTSRYCNGLRQLRIWGLSGFSGTYHLLLLLNLLLWSLLPKIVPPSGRRNHLSYVQVLSYPDETRQFWPGEPTLRVSHALLAYDTSLFPTDG